MYPMGMMPGMPRGSTPILVLNQQMKRESGRKAQLANIAAARAVSDIVRTTLGPRSMLKMILDPNGGIVLTNDGNAILREIDVAHPAAKSMIELSRTQDEEVGDGTTSVIVLGGEMVSVAEPFMAKEMHPTIVVESYFKALDDALVDLTALAQPIDVNNEQELLDIITACVGTKFSTRYGRLICDLALQAVKTIVVEENGTKEVDFKKYARVEKIPGGTLEDSRVLKGVMLNKDLVHPKMRRKIHNPRIVLCDFPLEYKKGESQTNVEVINEGDFEALLKAEEEVVIKMCTDILKFKPDVVVTEKGLSDIASHFLMKNGVSALRRTRKTDNLRIARCSGASIVHLPEEIQERDVGTRCGLFQIEKIGDEYFSFFVDCEEPKACSIVLRGASKDFLNEIERNLIDAMHVVRNILLDPRRVPGGGATEMALSHKLMERSKSIDGVGQWPYQSVAQALEVIPRTLCQNCGANTIRVMTELRSRHASGENAFWGIDGILGTITDMRQLNIWEPFVVKAQTLKTAVESACMMLRIDDILSGISHKGNSGPAPGQEEGAADEAVDQDTFGDSRDG